MKVTLTLKRVPSTDDISYIETSLREIHPDITQTSRENLTVSFAAPTTEVDAFELILLIASYLPSESSLAALVLSNRRLHGICNPCLHQYNAFHGNSSCSAWAAENGEMDTLQKALDAGAPLRKEQPKARRTIREFQPHPISLAASAGQKNIVRYMIDRGVSANISNPEGHTLLALAAIHGDASLAKYSLDVGAWQGIRSFVGHRPVWIAAFEGHADVVDVLLSAPKQTVNDGGSDFAPLQIVAPGEEPDLILNQHRPQPYAPLVIAARQGHEELVRMLIPGTATLNRTKALAYAVLCGNRGIVEILLQGGASPQFRSSDIPDSSECREEWVQPLLSAVQGNDRKSVGLLLDYGADVNVRSPQKNIQTSDRPLSTPCSGLWKKSRNRWSICY
ncbi:hypothetical protein N7465_000153 [Penicillium sp. CMV-2018d]|nr:hypothetical protein N7465_000153 [Penicillium sp. CMV-2018d]